MLSLWLETSHGEQYSYRNRSYWIEKSTGKWTRERSAWNNWKDLFT